MADGKVTFRWKDYTAKGKQRLMTLTAEEFLRRFLIHTLPRGFVRIRFSGFLANRRRAHLLPVCRRLLEQSSHIEVRAPATVPGNDTGVRPCPLCGGPMILVERLTAHRKRQRLPSNHPIESAAAPTFTTTPAFSCRGAPDRVLPFL
jgi:hypothetical protein